MGLELGHSVLKIILVVSAVFTAGSMVGLHFTGKKLDRIKNEKIESLEKEKNAIKDLEATMKVVISGDWSAPPIVRVLSPINNECYMVLKDGSYGGDVSFFAVEPYEFKARDDSKLEFFARVAAKNGSFPIGKNRTKIEGHKTVSIQIPFIAKDNFKKKEIIIEEIIIEYFINGKSSAKIEERPTYLVPLNENKMMAWANFSMAYDESVINESTYE